MEDLPYRIREAREAAGLTQEALARATGLAHRSIQNWEAGSHQPRVENLAKIARETGKPLGFFLVPREATAKDLAGVEKHAMRMASRARRTRRYLEQIEELS